MERPLRIGIDLDGVLADFASAFHAVEHRLFGDQPEMPAGQPEQQADAAGPEPAGPGTADPEKPAPPPPPPFDHRLARQRREAIWAEIRRITDFWTTLTPLVPGAVGRLHELALRHRWEVFFITRRPATDGESVQRQTQRWLVRHGYELPSVLVIDGSRGAAAAALRLDYHVDDDLQNCLDVRAAAGTKVIYVTAETGPPRDRLHGMGIGTAPGFAECLDALDEATTARANPALLKRLAALIGWR